MNSRKITNKNRRKEMCLFFSFVCLQQQYYICLHYEQKYIATSNTEYYL